MGRRARARPETLIRSHPRSGRALRGADAPGAPARSGTKKRTKTQLTREIPVHPTLALVLDDWLARGWAETYGRTPTPDDLIIPTQAHTVRDANNSRHALHRDLENLGLRARRSHDLRRTFITLARADGGRADVLRPLTHPGERDIIGLYTTFPWPVTCAELAKLQLQLQLPLPSGSPVIDLAAPAPEQAPPAGPEALAAIVSISEIAARRRASSAGDTPGDISGDNPDRHPENLNGFSDPNRARTCDLRFRKGSNPEGFQADRSESTRPSESRASAPTRTIADSRDGGVQPAPDFMDAILYELLNAQAVWLATRDPAVLRRRLIAMLPALG